jgi:hypothetical protein
MRRINARFVILNLVLLNWKEFTSVKDVRSLSVTSVEKIKKKSLIKKGNGLNKLIEFVIYVGKTSLKYMIQYKNLICIGQNKQKCLNNGFIISTKISIKTTNTNTF